jgi:glycosyltransferase involved in cell wall biosynthesis
VVDLTNLEGRRVLVVGINYAPEHTGIAPYTTQAADFLAARGAEVFVLAGVPHYPHWTVPSGYRGRARTDERHGAVEVRRLRHTVPRRQTALSRSLYEGTFGLHVAGQRLPWQPEVVLAVVPSLFGAIAAARIARRHGAPLVLWVQDLMGAATAQSGIAGGGRLARITQGLESWAIRRAAAVLVVSEAFRRHLVREGADPRRVTVVPNWTHVVSGLSDREAVRTRLGWDEEETVALHSGNMGLKQGLGNVVDAARLAAERGEQIRFVLMGDGSQRAALELLAADVPSLSMLPPASADDFAEVLGAADVLLVNERASARDMSLPSKLTSYFSVGVAVVAAVPDGGGTATEVERSGGGWVVPPDDPEALYAAIRELAADPHARTLLGWAGAVHAIEHMDSQVSLRKIAAVLGAAMHGAYGAAGGPGSGEVLVGHNAGNRSPERE